MVGNHQAAGFDPAKNGVQLNTQNIESLPRPALLELQATAVACEWIGQHNNGGNPQDMQAETQGFELDPRGAWAGDVIQLSVLFPMKWRA